MCTECTWCNRISNGNFVFCFWLFLRFSKAKTKAKTSGKDSHLPYLVSCPLALKMCPWGSKKEHFLKDAEFQSVLPPSSQGDGENHAFLSFQVTRAWISGGFLQNQNLGSAVAWCVSHTEKSVCDQVVRVIQNKGTAEQKRHGCRWILLYYSWCAANKHKFRKWVPRRTGRQSHSWF